MLVLVIVAGVCQTPFNDGYSAFLWYTQAGKHSFPLRRFGWFALYQQRIGSRGGIGFKPISRLRRQLPLKGKPVEVRCSIAAFPFKGRCPIGADGFNTDSRPRRSKGRCGHRPLDKRENTVFPYGRFGRFSVPYNSVYKNYFCHCSASR